MEKAGRRLGRWKKSAGEAGRWKKDTGEGTLSEERFSLPRTPSFPKTFMWQTAFPSDADLSGKRSSGKGKAPSGESPLRTEKLFGDRNPPSSEKVPPPAQARPGTGETPGKGRNFGQGAVPEKSPAVRSAETGCQWKGSSGIQAGWRASPRSAFDSGEDRRLAEEAKACTAQ